MALMQGAQKVAQIKREYNLFILDLTISNKVIQATFSE